MNGQERIEYAKKIRGQMAERVAGTVRTTALVNTILGASFLVIGLGFAGVAVVALAGGGGKGTVLAGASFVAAPILLVLGAVFFVVGRRMNPNTARLMAMGLHGRATLVEVGAAALAITTGTGLSAHRSALTLDVAVDGRPSYRVVHRTYVPLGSVRRLLPGTSFAVRVHPTKPGELAIVWDEAQAALD